MDEKSNSNRVCQILKIAKPVIQGPMFWLTDAKLVASVSEAGGLGVLGPHAGQNSLPKDDIEKAERMRQEIRKVKELTSKPFGINIFHSGQNPDIQLQLLLKVVYEEKVPVAVVVHDGPEIAEDIIKELKSHEITVVYRQITITPEIAKKAEKAGADIIVATGMDEGGTLPNHNIGTFSIVPLIVDSVKIPVMAAGGITDRRTFNASFALGAEGVFCGTLFLSAKEARTAQNVKEMILKTNATDMDFFRSMPYYYRSIPTPLSQKLVQMDKELKTREEISKAMNPMRNMKFGMLDGQTDIGYVSVGLGVSMIHSIRPSKEIIDDITQDFKP
jgi:enoyl-[acyl-carrier protein] reductase II